MPPSRGSAAMMKNSPLIKGFVPVRLRLELSSADHEGGDDETFFYVREHRTSSSSSDNSAIQEKQHCTLFVTNVPVVPQIRTKLLLQSLFGRFGDIERVTVVSNPTRRKNQHSDGDTGAQDDTPFVQWWNDDSQLQVPTFLAPNPSQGRYAHVVFTSPKELRKTLRALTEIMSATPARNSRVNDDDSSSSSSEGEDEKLGDSSYPALTLDRIELQTLADETQRQYREEQGDDLKDSDDEDNGGHARAAMKRSAVQRVADRYRSTCRRRDVLLNECNVVMEQFEAAEELDQAARRAAAEEPDEDGFVTVRPSATAKVGSKRDLEQSAHGERRRKGQQRSRKKKKTGTTELADFYRFQTKEKRKKAVEELRERFNEDLARVQKMKGEDKYRPF